MFECLNLGNVGDLDYGEIIGQKSGVVKWIHAALGHPGDDCAGQWKPVDYQP